MNTIRHFALLLTVGAVSMVPIQARSQQEVAPEHFDEPVSKVATKAPAAQVKSVHHSQHHQHSNGTNIAAKHGGRRGHGHSRSS